jgi:hypothetical protein
LEEGSIVTTILIEKFIGKDLVSLTVFGPNIEEFRTALDEISECASSRSVDSDNITVKTSRIELKRGNIPHMKLTVSA